jgi:hypothetical protein
MAIDEEELAKLQGLGESLAADYDKSMMQPPTITVQDTKCRTTTARNDPTSSKEDDDEQDDSAATTTSSRVPWLTHLPIALVTSTALLVLLWTWPKRHDGWTTWLLCRASFFTLVCLVMSPELRLRLATLPRRARRALSKRFAHSSSGAKKKGEEEDWGRGLPVRPLTKYSWDDDGEYVRVRVHLEGVSLSPDDAKADISPVSFHLQIRTEKEVLALKAPKLNNVIDHKGSSVRVQSGGKVVLKLHKWHDRVEWRHLVDTGGNRIQAGLADALSGAGEKVGVAAAASGEKED